MKRSFPAPRLRARAAVLRRDVAHAETAKKPTLKLKTLDGATFDLAAQRGNWVIVNFWATWCSPCIKEMPDISQLRREPAATSRRSGLPSAARKSRTSPAFLKKHPVQVSDRERADRFAAEGFRSAQGPADDVPDRAGRKRREEIHRAGYRGRSRKGDRGRVVERSPDVGADADRTIRRLGPRAGRVLPRVGACGGERLGCEGIGEESRRRARRGDRERDGWRAGGARKVARRGPAGCARAGVVRENIEEQAFSAISLSTEVRRRAFGRVVAAALTLPSPASGRGESAHARMLLD